MSTDSVPYSFLQTPNLVIPHQTPTLPFPSQPGIKLLVIIITLLLLLRIPEGAGKQPLPLKEEYLQRPVPNEVKL